MNPISLHNIYLGLYFNILEDWIQKIIISIINQGYFLNQKYIFDYWLYWYPYEFHLFTKYSFMHIFWFIRRLNSENHHKYHKFKDTFQILNISLISGFIDTPMNTIYRHKILLRLYFDILKVWITKMIISIKKQGYFSNLKYKCDYWLHWYPYKSHISTQCSFIAIFGYVRRLNHKKIL